MLSYPQDVKSSSDLVKGDFAADEYRGATRLQGLIDLCILAGSAPIEDTGMSGASVTSTSYSTVDSGTILVPHLVEAAIADRLIVIVAASITATNTGTLRLSLTGQTPIVADEVTVTNTSPADTTVQSTQITAEEFDALSVTTWTLEGKVDAGTMTVTAYAAALFWSAD